MWERIYEQGRWNGLALNILSTTLDGGQRLHISEIPYADLPLIKVMGSAASNVSLEVVMVGANSLVDANALLASLATTPKGELEHPWLGELPLVFKTHSLTIDTKRGVVTLSLAFVVDGKAPTLSPVVAGQVVHVEAQAAAVIEVSTASFIEEIYAASVAQINEVQAEFTSLVTQLQRVSNMLAIPSQILSELSTELNGALVAISSIANAPAQFAGQLSHTIKRVAKVVRSEGSYASTMLAGRVGVSGGVANMSLVSSAIDNARIAQAAMLNLVNPDSPSHHFNVQLVVAAALMNKDIAALEQRDNYSVVASGVQPVVVFNDLQRLAVQIDARIVEATEVSTVESLALFNALVVLRDGVGAQVDKVKLGSTPVKYDTLMRGVPALALAHNHHASDALVVALNPSLHPLFLCGDVAIAVAS